MLLQGLEKDLLDLRIDCIDDPFAITHTKMFSRQRDNQFVRFKFFEYI